ncbi:alpha/beta fold hydrolase [Dyella sp. C9]|uniref:alpha/beta fold hydrolase n=1 Tax=Dyella sp. C9 TaxID=2202154 RepID=UPI0018E56E34|nr:alpha/beta hydrolase [Dyella sp. C9]
MRFHSKRGDHLNWLLLPGGPGIGSESLHELADAMAVPGQIWLVDLPGDGSNTLHDDDDPYSQWPQVLVEAAQVLPNAVYVGHSTGGMYLLATPQLHGLVRGLALLDTAPDASWHPAYVEMTRKYPLPAFEQAAVAYAEEKSIGNLTTLAVSSAEWNFTADALEVGRALLARMPYNSAAVEWSDACFDHSYRAAWWPTDIPVLRLWGDRDRIVTQRGWSAPKYNTPNVMVRPIARAGHFPWIDNPGEVAEAFSTFARRVMAA